LNEKVSLLNEVHHRVKNNLQVITSLLRLEAGRSVQQQTKNVLNDMQGRIRSMALLHESLYRAGIFASIDLGTYIADLATQGFRAQTSGGGVVRLRLDLESVDVTMDQAMPCGLLINELISNSLKHGFANGRSGEVCVTLSKKSDEPIVMMRVSDNGCGLPEDFEAQRGQSLGLQLVADLVSQLGGTMEISSASDLEGGAQFDISFAIDMVKLQTSNVA
jgi:two-component sensor histidine kinase